MKGWVGLVGWPVADGLPTLVVTHLLQVERRTGKVRQSETDVRTTVLRRQPTQHSAGRIRPTTDSRIPEHCHTCNCTVSRNICYWHWTLFFQLILHVDVVLCNCSNSRISDPWGGYLNPCVWNVRHFAIRHSLRCSSLSDACLNGRVISAL